MPEVEAKIGCWYQMPGGQMFEVVALDGDGAIDIQYFDGEVEELDDETWGQMSLAEASAPEDWTGAYDKIDREDLGYSDAVIQPENWAGPLRAFEKQDYE